MDNKLASRGLDDLVPGGLGVVRLSGSEGDTLGHFLKYRTKDRSKTKQDERREKC